MNRIWRQVTKEELIKRTKGLCTHSAYDSLGRCHFIWDNKNFNEDDIGKYNFSIAMVQENPDGNKYFLRNKEMNILQKSELTFWLPKSRADDIIKLCAKTEIKNLEIILMPPLPQHIELQFKSKEDVEIFKQLFGEIE